MTTGPLPRAVYWRRRFVVLVVLVLLVLLVVWLVRSAGNGQATSAPPTTPAPTTSGAPTTGVPDCAPPALAVTIAADAADVAIGTAATFTITITNGGTDECVVDAGELQREVVVVSGSDRIWSSKDCAPADSPARSLLLGAGMSDTTQLAWSLVRSAPGCTGDLPAPKPGTYQATVSLAGTSSGPTVFRLN
jgi:hypothetical protein